MTDAGSIYGCGSNSEGQLGIGDVPTGDPGYRATLTQIIISGISGTPTTITSGVNTSFVLTDADLIYGCGRNNYGQLGIGDVPIEDPDYRATLTQMITSGISGTPTTITADGDNFLVLTNSGNVYGCGRYDRARR